MNEYRIAQAVCGRPPSVDAAAVERREQVRARRVLATDPSAYARAQIATTLAEYRVVIG